MRNSELSAPIVSESDHRWASSFPGSASQSAFFPLRSPLFILFVFMSDITYALYPCQSFTMLALHFRF